MLPPVRYVSPLHGWHAQDFLFLLRGAEPCITISLRRLGMVITLTMLIRGLRSLPRMLLMLTIKLIITVTLL